MTNTVSDTIWISSKCFIDKAVADMVRLAKQINQDWLDHKNIQVMHYVLAFGHVVRMSVSGYRG